MNGRLFSDSHGVRNFPNSSLCLYWFPILHILKVSCFFVIQYAEIQEQLFFIIPRNVTFISLIYFFITSTSSKRGGKKRMFYPSIFYLAVSVGFMHLWIHFNKRKILQLYLLLSEARRDLEINAEKSWWSVYFGTALPHPVLLCATNSGTVLQNQPKRF